MGTHWLNVERDFARIEGLRFGSADRPKPRNLRKSSAVRKTPAEGDDLPYRVEVWNAAKTAVEQVVAVTASASIGQAAFYAAAREFPERYVTLKHKQSVINRWNGPSH